MNTQVDMLAAFISPSLFYAGAGAVSLPILIHLLARRRFKRVRWAAVEFLLDAEKRNRRRVRLEEWLLLLLRCLAVLLLGLLLARPYLRPNGVAAAMAGADRTEHVFVIDDSFSMGYQVDDGPVMDRAKRATRRLIELVRQEAPDDTVTIIRMSDPANPVEFGTYLDDTQSEQVLARLEALTPSQSAADPATAITGTAALLRRGGDVVSACVYVISDFQRYNWVERLADGEVAGEVGEAPAGTIGETSGEQTGAGAAGEAEPSLLTPLRQWAGDDRGLKVVFVNVGEAGAGNRVVSNLSLGDTRLVAGTPGRVMARVSNWSPAAVSNLDLSVSVGQRAAGNELIDQLGPLQSTTVGLDVEFLRAGDESLSVTLPADALPIDDTRYLAAAVSNAIRILIVNGEPSADAYNDEVSLLATALRPEGDVFSGNEVTVIDETKLEDTKLDDYHAVVLANVYRLSEPARENLERYVRRGGGAMFFLGDVIDAEWYNQSLYRAGEGPFPLELGEIMAPAKAANLKVVHRTHPAMRGISRAGDPLGLGTVQFFSFYSGVPAGGERPDGAGADEAEASETDRPALRPSADVLASFNDADNSPAIVERSFGAGKVMVVTSSADKEWNIWADHPTYLPVMMELTLYVARSTGAFDEQLVGAPISIRLDPAEYEPDAEVRTPAYPTEQEIGLTAKPADDGMGMVLSYESAHQAGVYQFVLPKRGGGETVRLVAVNVCPAEGDLSGADEDGLRHAITDVPFTYIKGTDGLSEGRGEGRTEIWPLVLIGAMGLLMSEHVFAWWCGRRR